MIIWASIQHDRRDLPKLNSDEQPLQMKKPRFDLQKIVSPLCVVSSFYVCYL
jgi:hypothetical protein